MEGSSLVSINHPSHHKPPSTAIPQDLDGPACYSPMHERTRLISDGSQLYQVSSGPPYLDLAFDIDIDLATCPIPGRTTLTVPAVAVAPPAVSSSSSAGAGDSAGTSAPPAQAGAGTEAEAETTTHQPLSDRAARAHIAVYIRSVPWYQGHAMGPCVREAGVRAAACPGG